MKYLKNSVFENLTLDYLKNISSFVSGKQLEYYQWQIDNAKNIIISSTPKEYYYWRTYIEKLLQKFFQSC